MVHKRCENGFVWDKIQKYCRVPKKRGPKKLSAGSGDYLEEDEFLNAAASQQLELTVKNPLNALSDQNSKASKNSQKKKYGVVF
jgi:hypothetical protein